MPEDEAPPTPVSAADMESKVRTAMISRVPYFKEQADSLTFEGVRRLLEKDLGLETFALDVHKRFVKQCLQECLESGNEDEGAKNADDAEMTISSADGLSADKNEQKEELKEPNSKDGMEESPVMGLMAGHEKSKSETQTTKDAENHTAPSEAMIKKAIINRALHFRNNSENITMVGVRRLLEEDLKLDKFALDPFKKIVSEQVNEVLTHTEVAKSETSDKKGVVKKRMPKKSREAESSGASSESESEVDEDEVKPRRKSTPKGKTGGISGLKKRKRSEKDVKEPKRKEPKASKVESEESSEAEGSGDGSEEEKIESTAEKSAKIKEVPKPSYGKRVEKIKSIIKSCGMSIPPSTYKKVKDVPDNKREAALIKELENILAKEGLSANPSEKEIKEVKKRKERAKELEGIDMSNIVSSSRRRSTLSFVPPPKPKIPAESDADSGESEDGDDDDDEDEEQDEEEDGASKSEEDAGDDNGDSD